jgi:hypothetical protein
VVVAPTDASQGAVFDVQPSSRSDAAAPAPKEGGE